MVLVDLILQEMVGRSPPPSPPVKLPKATYVPSSLGHVDAEAMLRHAVDPKQALGEELLIQRVKEHFA